MSTILPFVVSGIAVGAIYGLAATGLVLTYKTSGIFNFGHGALATTGAYVFYWLLTEHSLDWKYAALVSVLLVGPLMGLLMDAVAARLGPQRTELKIVGTVGLVLVVQGLASIKYGTSTIRVDQFLPGASESFRLFGVVITYDKVIVTAVAVFSVAALYAFFRWSRVGLAMRGVVESPNLVAMHGTDPARVRRIAWVIGSTFAALSGVLIVPFVGLDAVVLTLLVVQAFGAAAIGGFSSIPLTLAGGLLIGVAVDIFKKYSFSHEWLTGLPQSVPFIVLFLVLLVLGRRLVAPSRGRARSKLQYHAPSSVRIVAGVIAVAILAAIPHFVGGRLVFFTTGLVTVVMLLSLGLLVRMSGQVSLCHAAFAGIGAVAFSQLVVEQGVPWLVALLLAGMFAVPFGAVVAIPAIRLSGLFLALATLGFGILVERLLYPQSWMFGTFVGGRPMPQPSFAQTPVRFYYVVLCAVVITSVFMVVIERSRLGRMLRALSDSPRGVEAMGLSTNVVRVTVFCISAFFAAEAGVLLGVLRHVADSGDPFFGPFNSILLLAMLAVAPFGGPWFALAGGLGVVLPGYIGGADTPYWASVVFGCFAVIVAMVGDQPAMPIRFRTVLDRFAVGVRRSTSFEPEVVAPTRVHDGDAPGLEVRNLTVRFGGLVAVRRLSIRGPLRQITGLIGPNGAGKTSTFDACSGFNRKFAGSVLLHGRDVTRRSPAARARLGLGRTFQFAELCDTLTVIENVRLGHEAARAGASPLTQLAADRRTMRFTESAAMNALNVCDLGQIANRQAGVLSTGQRRLVEFARCLAGSFDYLLLDEPSSGLDEDETQRFGDLLLRVVDRTGIGVLLIEHDMAFVMRLCGYLYVMDSGELIWEGIPSRAIDSAVVRSAYLGSGADTGSIDTATDRSRPVPMTDRGHG